MKALKQFSVPFTGLKLGVHHFDYELDDAFFNAFDYSLIKSGHLKVNMELDKQETMLILKFKVLGSVNLDCDKCLSEFPLPINLYERQIVKFEEAGLESDDEEIISLSRKDTEIDISIPLYEMINVAVPYIRNCEQANKDCDQEMINRLENLSIEHQNEENEQTSDPRWEALNKLKK
ncbi:YceD family protein [Pedobacter sp. MW01-1-1]|uniref:YceD family protein n=1 Tax=Pedobacter sp. MW01-1-1 TaxID=3383027 RepID=UPI003FF0F1F9